MVVNKAPIYGAMAEVVLEMRKDGTGIDLQLELGFADCKVTASDIAPEDEGGGRRPSPKPKIMNFIYRHNKTHQQIRYNTVMVVAMKV